MKKLPIGIQTFRKIIEESYLYIDKTKEIFTLLESGQIFFLSRPRRFGKSLQVSTLKEIFIGNRELFKGLYIYDQIEWNQFPVIHIDFSTITHDHPDHLLESMDYFLENRAEEASVKLKATLPGDKFKELIEKLSKKGNVVVLVDEYDKPIIGVLPDFEKAKANREILRNLFTVLKGTDPFLKFVFLTGVSKFSKVSIFSGLNNILDITIDERFSTLLGITDEELINSCAGYLDILGKKLSSNRDDLLNEIQYWYNGYSWDGEKKVYNPTSLFTLFTQNRFSNYWFATGTPTFLINLMKEKKVDIADLDHKTIGEYVFESYDIENLDIHSLLFQTGYLTIVGIRKKRSRLLYELVYPNFEVKESLLNHILAAYSDKGITETD